LAKVIDIRAKAPSAVSPVFALFGSAVEPFMRSSDDIVALQTQGKNEFPTASRRNL
jgi:hypothetical protein